MNFSKHNGYPIDSTELFWRTSVDLLERGTTKRHLRFSFPERLDQQQATVATPTGQKRQGLQVRDNDSKRTVKILLENAFQKGAIRTNGGNTYKLWSEGRGRAKTLITLELRVALGVKWGKHWSAPSC